jgi:hypothetical protein
VKDGRKPTECTTKLMNSWTVSALEQSMRTENKRRPRTLRSSVDLSVPLGPICRKIDQKVKDELEVDPSDWQTRSTCKEHKHTMRSTLDGLPLMIFVSSCSSGVVRLRT